MTENHSIKAENHPLFWTHLSVGSFPESINNLSTENRNPSTDTQQELYDYMTHNHPIIIRQNLEIDRSAVDGSTGQMSDNRQVIDRNRQMALLSNCRSRVTGVIHVAKRNGQ